MHVGAGGTVGQPERACGCQRRLALRARRRWRGRCAPGRPWQPGHCLALRARRRRRGRCAPGRLHVLLRVLRTLSPGGSGDVEDVVRCALLERLGARRASSSCRGRGWGGTPREPQCHRLRHARAERRHGGSWQEGGARAASSPLQGLTPPVRRPRAAGAPWEARARAARVQTAGEDLVVGGGGSNSELPQAGFPLIGGSIYLSIYPHAPCILTGVACMCNVLLYPIRHWVDGPG